MNMTRRTSLIWETKVWEDECDRCVDRLWQVETLFAQLHFHSDTTSWTRDLVTILRLWPDVCQSRSSNVRCIWSSIARMYRIPLNQFSLSLNLFVGAVEKLCICVTFAKKLGDWWCKLQLPDLSLLNSQISDTSPLSDFKLTFRFLPQRPVFNDGCVSVSREGRRKWSFIGIWRPGLPNACPTKLGLILGQKLQVARSTVAE